MRERVQNRQLHARRTELGEHAPVRELDERVHYALRVHDDVDVFIWDAKEVVSLDYLERFIRQRRAVDGDLATHLPRRMTQRVVDGRGAQLQRGPLSKRTAGRSDDQSADVLDVAAGDALQN